MSKIGIIISREFRERVRKKSFIITTILTPLFILGICIGPSLMMLHDSGETRHIVVVDNTDGAFVGNALKSGSTLEFQLLEDMTGNEARLEYGEEDSAFGILLIESDILEHPDHIQLITNTASSLIIEEEIEDQVSEILRLEKLRSYGIEEIDKILEESDIRVSLTTLKNSLGDEESMEEVSSGMSMGISMVLGLLLYMFIIIYGQQVMNSVIEEKQSRVLDVIVTSCSPFDMMMGKILGIAAVAAVQIVIWCVLIAGTSALITPSLLADSAEMTEAMGAVSLTIGNVGYILKLFLWLFLYIVGGFLLYASLYAAVGSSVDAVQDAQQFNTVLMMPIILSIIVMTSVINDPNSSLVFWCSLIPFTSPIVMMARIPFDIPGWQIAVSLVLLYGTFLLTTVIAARIYRIGIFMHGKKPTWKDLGQWLRMK